jgi:hypothetical protein
MIAIAFTRGPVHPGLTSWVILSRPCGTDRGGQPYPGLRPGLFSAVPKGLIAICPIADLFLTTAIRISRSEKLIWTSLTLSRPSGTGLGGNVDPRTDVLGYSQQSPFGKLRAGSSGLIDDNLICF